jgi:hypothetical protein
MSNIQPNEQHLQQLFLQFQEQYTALTGKAIANGFFTDIDQFPGLYGIFIQVKDYPTDLLSDTDFKQAYAIFRDVFEENAKWIYKFIIVGTEELIPKKRNQVYNPGTGDTYTILTQAA